MLDESDLAYLRKIGRMPPAEPSATTDDTDGIEGSMPAPDTKKAKLIFCADPSHEAETPSGVIYQRCGGGRRILRKRI